MTFSSFDTHAGQKLENLFHIHTSSLRSEVTCHSFVKSFSGVNPRNKMAASSA